MHEYAVTRSLINTIIDECEKQKGATPRKVLVELGELTSYQKESVLFFFEALKKETPLLSQTDLEIKKVSPLIYCHDCESLKTPVDLTFIYCPDCTSNSYDVKAGKEFLLKEIELEEPHVS